MTYNSGIILGGAQPDIFGAFERGSSLGRQNALTDLYRTQGPEIAAGNRNALNALAQFGPQAAFDMQESLDERARAAETASREDWRFNREVEKYAADLSAAEAKAKAERIERAVAAGLATRTPEEWDAVVRQFGAADLVGQFEGRDAIAQGYMSIADALKLRSEKPDPFKGAPQGYYLTDPANPAAGVARLPGYVAEPADDYERYVREETAAGRQPMGRIDYEQAKKGQETVYGPDGTPIVSRGPASGKPPTDGGLASAGYLQRMIGAERIMDDLTAAGSASIGLSDTVAVGTRFEPYKLSVPEQKLMQAQRDWVRAKLRKESGAVISEAEMADEIRTYFPQPGEGPEIIQQKRDARKAAERQMQITSGSASDLAGPLTDSGQAAAPSPAGSIALTPEQQSVFDKYK